MSSKTRTIYLNYTKNAKRSRMNSFKRLSNQFDLKTGTLHSGLAILLVISLSLSLISGTSLCFQSPQSQEKEQILAAELPTLSLFYYSNWNDTLLPLDSGDRISGDHITLNATWSPSENANGSLIEVNATAIPMVIAASNNESSVEIDTRALGNNATVTINCTTWLTNGTPISQLIENVFLGNFFKPHIEIVSPNGGEVWTGVHNITWQAWDNNTQESLTFEVLLSADGGKTFQLLESDLTTTWVEWDTTGFSNLSTYMVQVRASDGIYVEDDTSDSTFTAGDVATGPPNSTTTDTTTNGNEDLRTALFIAAAIILSAFFAVIVYYLAKREF
ncbi:hypothetical protein EU537_00330 [Candidatus Thorarchaeota archaeon]|nr:MAG: hypothetical protein EU537_00330 [Candidatus Thorarchaeota archaeon]